MKLYSPAAVRQIIDKYNFRFQKSLGQNFLIDGNIISKIIEAVDVQNSDTILEIGPGIGALTRALAEKASFVTAVEIDRHLRPVLEETLDGCSNVNIYWGDALKTDFDRLVFGDTDVLAGRRHKPYKLVANLPYYITTPLIMHALESRFKISVMVIMVQKEVAERIVASPGSKSYGILTLAVNYYSEPCFVMRVPKTVFMPEPEVESAVIRLKLRESPPFEVKNEETFFRVVRAAFGQRRKTLANTLPGLAEGLDKVETARLLSGLGIDPGRRGETLSFEEFAKIANTVFILKQIKCG